MALLEVEHLSHSYGDKILYQDASFELYKGEHMGIVGQNGTGKSTLIKILLNEVIPDKGSVKWQNNVTIGHLDQYAIIDQNLTILDYLRTAFQDLYEMETKLNNLYNQMAENCTDALLKQVAYYQDILEKRNFYAIDSTIQKYASGLGVSALGMDTILKNLSGGSRAKVILVKLLLSSPDILILDEPTNFLDKEHISWLANYLQSTPASFIIVSHDYDFLEKVTTCICDIEFSQIKKYKGPYSKFLKQKEANREEYIKQYEFQQKEIKKLEDYIAKNKVRASTANMAKSREKRLNKMEKLAKPATVSKPHFHFSYLQTTGQVLLDVTRLEVGYYYTLLPPLSFEVRRQDKLVITGFNGIGKSTLLKTLLGQIPSRGGTFHFGESVKQIGYFEQDLNWDNPKDTPLHILSEAFPKLNQKQIRSALASVAIKNEHMIQEIGTLSGGEQAKVKLCMLVLTPCNMLILDEPTNHLDVEAKEVLKKALKEFEGTIILVSHEESFYKDLATRIVDIRSLAS